jgi:hypothetical protein
MFRSTSKFNRNLYKKNFIDANDRTITSGVAKIENSKFYFLNTQSVEITKSNHQTTDLVFNFNEQLKHIKPTISGDYFIFGFSIGGLSIPLNLKVNYFLNNNLEDTWEFTTDAMPEPNVQFQSYFKDFFNQANGGSIDFTIEVLANPLQDNTITFYLDGFYLLEKKSDNFSIDFVKGGNPTLWADRTDLINTQNLTASTNNIVQITTATEGNGFDFASFFDANGKVTPINQNDVVSVDFSCTIETPSGSDRFIDVKALVDGVAYRQITHKLLKGSGNLDQLSVSWILPVKEAFKLNGLQIALNPNSDCTISDRYISVTRIHEAL